MKSVAALAIAISLFRVVTGIKYDKDAENEALELNREKWHSYSGGTPNYNFQLERICFCPLECLGPFDMKVRDNHITSAKYANSPQDNVNADIMDGLLTIDGVFDQIERAIAEEYEDLDVTYDSERGYPISFWYDISDMIEDDQLTFLLSKVQLLGGKTRKMRKVKPSFYFAM